MTRFARARGSKASNKKVPEEASSWQVLKQSIHKSKELTNSENNENGSKEKVNWKVTLKNEEQALLNKKSVWAEFDTESSTKQPLDNIALKKKDGQGNIAGNKKQGKNFKAKQKYETVEENGEYIKKKENKKSMKKSKKLKHSKPSLQETENHPESVENETKVSSGVNKKSNKLVIESNIQHGKNYKIGEHSVHEIKNSNEKKRSLNDNVEDQCYKKQKLVSNSFGRFDNVDEGKHSFDKPASKFQHLKYDGVGNEDLKLNTPNSGFKRKQDYGNQWDNQVFKRRKPNTDNNFTLDINGKRVEIELFDGFPIKKEDADRLKELRQKLIEKNLPKSEIQFTIKAERRKAEKILSREKKKVCFHCRLGGHNLSECPKLSSSQEMNTRVCYKCGSTEHLQNHCKVADGDQMRFARCFICNEEGHISRQCPDNPRGLYPKGGACRVCGDVTHFKKDCPKLVEEKSENKVTISTFSQDVPVDELDEEMSRKPVSKLTTEKQHKKVVKF